LFINTTIKFIYILVIHKINILPVNKGFYFDNNKANFVYNKLAKYDINPTKKIKPQK